MMQLQQRPQLIPWETLDQSCPTEMSQIRQEGWTPMPHNE